MKWLLPLLSLSLVGCLSAVPNGPTTAPPAQVSACENDATIRNVTMIAGLGIPAVSGGLASAETQTSNQNTKNGLAWGIVGTTALSVILEAVSAVEGQNYTASGCVQILGTLPAGQQRKQ